MLALFQKYPQPTIFNLFKTLFAQHVSILLSTCSIKAVCTKDSQFLINYFFMKRLRHSIDNGNNQVPHKQQYWKFVLTPNKIL